MWLEEGGHRNMQSDAGPTPAGQLTHVAKQVWLEADPWLHLVLVDVDLLLI